MAKDSEIFVGGMPQQLTSETFYGVSREYATVKEALQERLQCDSRAVEELIGSTPARFAEAEAGHRRWGKRARKPVSSVAGDRLMRAPVPEDLSGLSCVMTYQGSCIDPGQRRWDAHKETMQDVVKMLQLVEWGRRAEPRKYSWFQDGDVKLFRSAKPSSDDLTEDMPWAEANRKDILGRFDVVSAKVSAKFGSDWMPLEGVAPQWTVLHSAAINLSGRPWRDFSRKHVNKGLNEDLYLRAMQRLFCNVLLAAAHEGIAKLLMFPFGMGAFLRRLHEQPGCEEYQIGSASSRRLRRQIVEHFLKALEATRAAAHVYLCIRVGAAVDKEAAENANAFLIALKAAPAHIRNRFTIVPDGDALQVAHDMAGASEPGSVAVLNGAARGNLGNGWFEGGALSAIDENLHRRSPRMAALSYLMNGFVDRAHGRPRRTASSLPDNVRSMGGEVVELPFAAPHLRCTNNAATLRSAGEDSDEV